MHIQCLFTLFLISTLQPMIYGAIYDCEIEPKDNYDHAAFRLWIPNDAPKVKGLILLLPGYCGDGRSFVDDTNWQKIASDNGMALVGCYFSESTYKNYHIAANGSGKALFDALKIISQESKHPEIQTIPFVLWGHSAGGQFAYTFTCWKPERVICFIAIKGGYYLDEPKAASKHVPGLLVSGKLDEEFRINNIRTAFEKGRKYGAPWILLEEPNSGHDLGRTMELTIPFIQTAIERRINPMGQSRNQLITPLQKDGWCGNLKTFEIMPDSKYKSSRADSSWFYSEDLALIWQNILNQK